MSIPDYQSLMTPLLQLASDGKEHSFREAVTYMAKRFHLSEEERSELLPSGTQRKLDNRVGWARTYLKKAGLLRDPRRGHFEITERGKHVLEQANHPIDAAFLKKFDEFREFQTATHKNDVPNSEEEEASYTPQEALEKAHQSLQRELADELLAKIAEMPPDFFESLVVELLVHMGYGGSLKDAGQKVGKSGDEEIDGIIKEDKLGLDVIYLQAKRWSSTVGRPEIQKFVGALSGQKARKGVFITTSTFLSDAVQYAANLDVKVVLIDGETLSQYMIEQDLGVSTVATYAIKKLDTDYFTED